MNNSQNYSSSQHFFEKRWLNTKEAAKYLGVSEVYLAKDRQTRLHGIPFSKAGKLVRYDRIALDAYFVSQGA